MVMIVFSRVLAPAATSGEVAQQQRAIDLAAAHSALAAKDADSAALTERLDALAAQLAAARQATRAMAEGKTLAFAKLKEVVARLRAVQSDASATAEVLDRERRAHRREAAALHAAKDEAFTSLRKVLERVKRDAAASAT